MVAPAGVAARGQVIGVKAKKKAPEKARLKLALTSLTIDGTTDSIQTKLVTTKAQDNSKSATATTSGGAGASDESGLVFKFTAPVTVNRQRRAAPGDKRCERLRECQAAVRTCEHEYLASLPDVVRDQHVGLALRTQQEGGETG